MFVFELKFILELYSLIYIDSSNRDIFAFIFNISSGIDQESILI